MNVIKKCCFRAMRENKKRTAVTIVGIILAVALITGVACLAVSFRASMIAYEKQRNGEYHYLFTGVNAGDIKIFENNKHIKKSVALADVGYATLEGSKNPDKPYLYLCAADREGLQNTGLHLTEGRLPENSSELMVSRHIRSNGQADVKVGDTLTLAVGKRLSDGRELRQSQRYLYQEEKLETAFEKTYTVVGMVERPNYTMEERMAPGYSVFTLLDSDVSWSRADVFAVYTRWGLRHADQVNAGLLGVSEDLYDRYYVNCGRIEPGEQEQILRVASNVVEHYWLLKWELLAFTSSTVTMLYSMAGLAVLIIIVTSVFCIRNAFSISLVEKMKLYGRLASVGTTAAQQRKMVYYEARFLGAVGIPLGLICGIGASAILVRAVSGMVELAMGRPLIFGVSFPAIAAAAVLSAVTVFLSSWKSARMAAKISPISAIRGNDSVKIHRRELKCPRIVGVLFGVGGKVAYKNLRRARGKYRTAVISIVVSVAVFIGLSTFMQLVMFATGTRYEVRPYQILVSVRPSDSAEAYERALGLESLEAVDALDIRRQVSMRTDGTRLPYTEEYKALFETGEEDAIGLITLGRSGYEEYCRKLGISAEKAKNKAIIIAEYNNTYYDREKGKLYTESGKTADFRQGDFLEGTVKDENDQERKLSLEVLLQTKERPMSMVNENHNYVVAVVSDEWAEAHLTLKKDNMIQVYVKCGDAARAEEEIRAYLGDKYTLTNYEENQREERALVTVIAVFLYGFITVVALIGITNIFNTITTNMELRAPEFAMLRSVGMTGREFNRMIWLEGFFYGGKALLIGLPLGVLLSFGFYLALGSGIVTNFSMPWLGMAIATAAVIVLLFGIMRYSLNRIRHKNIIETIQNENI